MYGREGRELDNITITKDILFFILKDEGSFFQEKFIGMCPAYGYYR